MVTASRGNGVFEQSIIRVPVRNIVQSFERVVVSAVIMEDTESFCSRAWDFMPADNRKQSHKVDVYNQVLHRLRDLSIPETKLPGFEDELWAHFHRLPARYALDVNAERAQDVLMHKRLLQMARDPATRHAIEVRVVQGNFATSGNLSSQRIGDAQCSYNSSKNAHPPPAFASSCDVELPVEVNHLHVQDRQNGMTENPPFSRAMHEITISTNDKRKIFSQVAGFFLSLSPPSLFLVTS